MLLLYAIADGKTGPPPGRARRRPRGAVAGVRPTSVPRRAAPTGRLRPVHRPAQLPCCCTHGLGESLTLACYLPSLRPAHVRIVPRCTGVGPSPTPCDAHADAARQCAGPSPGAHFGPGVPHGARCPSIPDEASARSAPPSRPTRSSPPAHTPRPETTNPISAHIRVPQPTNMQPTRLGSAGTPERGASQVEMTPPASRSPGG